MTYNSENQNDNLANGTSIMANELEHGFSMRARIDSKTDIHYAIPKEGVVGWFDSCGAGRREEPRERQEVPDFIMKPENIALQSNYARYSNAIVGSEAFMDKDLAAADELKVPESGTGEVRQACSPAAQKLIDRVWTKLLQ